VDAATGLLMTGTPAHSVSTIDGTVNVLQGSSGLNAIPPGYALVNNTGAAAAPTWVPITSVPGVGGGGGFTVRNISASWSPAAGDCDLVTTTSGNLTGTLPPAAANVNGEIAVCKVSSDANTITIVGSGGDTIRNGTSLTILYQYSSCTCISNGVNGWDLI
jgi:hypothetical protein